jgi:hypothetical protein
LDFNGARFRCSPYDLSDKNIEKILKKMDNEKLKTILITWINNAGYYFERAEHEPDLIRKTFFNASAMILKYCMDEIMSYELDEFNLGYTRKTFN